MSIQEGGYHVEGLHQVHEELDEQITKAEQRIQQWNEYQEALSEIDDAIAHFDSVACGTLKVNEREGTIVAKIAAPQIGERLRELHREHDWDSIEFKHLQDVGVFQVKMEMSTEGMLAPDADRTPLGYIEEIKHNVEEGLRATSMGEIQDAESALNRLVDIGREMQQDPDGSVSNRAAEELEGTARTLLQQLDDGDIDQVEDGLRHIDRLEFIVGDGSV
ncbi:hypothetical protein [Haloarcula sp. 1CSR25-25]|uniref:hypothetical protein n=1 Tax=Haloarcula sp. 1CSR25-25 TaxID=2862545 RepID=UPI00289558E1|nr:hypothetical protein [Haloarcula sp. 1CSR25-25]MDT3437830.1 hypothetical protein [Haloarcula sp. 1CSR25-25]